MSSRHRGATYSFPGRHFESFGSVQCWQIDDQRHVNPLFVSYLSAELLGLKLRFLRYPRACPQLANATEDDRLTSIRAFKVRFKQYSVAYFISSQMTT